MSLVIMITAPSPHQRNRGATWELALKKYNPGGPPPMYRDWPYSGDTARVMRLVRKDLDPKARRWQARVIIHKDLTRDQISAWLEKHQAKIAKIERAE